ncbi:hypothetical protein [Devosia sp.]|uniref:hypothetical protein n=1 Tax=Devosia sp. TaxID=1871048 RepID=UPI001ACBA91A|nr:hypothetical protein [Devosia sp.]MBN9335858.1 hypothetical protein [Devosia sp.]
MSIKSFVVAFSLVAGLGLSVGVVEAAPMFKPGQQVSLNPQPLPPKEATALNPQPLPPVAAKALNPQPLPPKENGLFNVRR